MNYYKLFLGVLVSILSILYLLHTIKSAINDKDYDAMTSSYDINIIFGIITFLLIGIILIYRELKVFL